MEEDDEEEIVYQPSTASSASSAPTTSIPFSSRATGINATALSILSAGSLALSAIPIGIALALLPSTTGQKPSMVLDPTMEEEAKATARFGFAWAIGHGAADSEGMDVDDEGMGMELVWTESEGSFTRSEVCHCTTSLSAVQRTWLINSFKRLCR
jgi:hypothetical protein